MTNSTRRRTSSKKKTCRFGTFSSYISVWSETGFIPVLSTENPAFKSRYEGTGFFIAVSQEVPNTTDYQLQAVLATRYHKVGIIVNLRSHVRKRILVP